MMKRLILGLLIFSNTLIAQSECQTDPTSDKCEIENLKTALVLLHEKFDKLTSHIYGSKGTGSQNLNINGANLILGSDDGLTKGSNKAQRALVHYHQDKLVLNFAGDFEGGTQVGSELDVEGQIKVRGVTVIDENRNTSANKLKIDSTEDVGLNDKGGLIIGSPEGYNIGIDPNEIMARHNKEKATLHLNAEGGLVKVGGDLSVAGKVNGKSLTLECYEKNGSRSGTNDDDTSSAVCNVGYKATGCSCRSPWDGCGDGSELVSDRECKAYNRNGGNGVYAKAICCRIH